MKKIVSYRSYLLLVCISALTACSPNNNFMRDYFGERQPQSVGGPRRVPALNPREPGTGPLGVAPAPAAPVMAVPVTPVTEGPVVEPDMPEQAALPPAAGPQASNEEGWEKRLFGWVPSMSDLTRTEDSSHMDKAEPRKKLPGNPVVEHVEMEPVESEAPPPTASAPAATPVSASMAVAEEPKEIVLASSSPMPEREKRVTPLPQAEPASGPMTLAAAEPAKTYPLLENVPERPAQLEQLKTESSKEISTLKREHESALGAQQVIESGALTDQPAGSDVEKSLLNKAPETAPSAAPLPWTTEPAPVSAEPEKRSEEQAPAPQQASEEHPGMVERSFTSFTRWIGLREDTKPATPQQPEVDHVMAVPTEPVQIALPPHAEPLEAAVVPVEPQAQPMQIGARQLPQLPAPGEHPQIETLAPAAGPTISIVGQTPAPGMVESIRLVEPESVIYLLPDSRYAARYTPISY